MSVLKYLEVPLWLAPMAGVIGSAFRRVVRAYPCGLVFTELLSAKGLLLGSETMRPLAFFTPDERPIAFQLYGAEPSVLAEAAALVVEHYSPEVIDINMGCPSKKIVRSGGGVALMENPQKVLQVAEAVSNAISPVPLTVKIRSGLHSGAINAVEVALAAQAGGASAVTVHPRTRAQGFKGKADWKIIGRVVEACSIPVVGSGDVLSPIDAKRMVDETGCAGVMIGRGALGRPWIFRQAFEVLNGLPPSAGPSPREIGGILLRQLLWEVELKGERRGVMEMRKHIIWYSRGMPNARTLRARISVVSTLEECKQLVVDFFSLEKEQADWTLKRRGDWRS